MTRAARAQGVHRAPTAGAATRWRVVLLDGVGRAGRAPPGVVAAELGLLQRPVFVDDAAAGRIQIFTPAGSSPFAGHPTVGTGRLLRRHCGLGGDVLRPPAGDVPTLDEDGLSWVRARPGVGPPDRAGAARRRRRG